VYTGAGQQFGEDIFVYLQMFGRHGDCGRRLLHKSLNNDIPFRSEQMDLFEIEAVYLGAVEQIIISVGNPELDSMIFMYYLKTVLFLLIVLSVSVKSCYCTLVASLYQQCVSCRIL
jgi:hypothetical protein